MDLEDLMSFLAIAILASSRVLLSLISNHKRESVATPRRMLASGHPRLLRWHSEAERMPPTLGFPLAPKHPQLWRYLL